MSRGEIKHSTGCFFRKEKIMDGKNILSTLDALAEFVKNAELRHNSDKMVKELKEFAIVVLDSIHEFETHKAIYQNKIPEIRKTLAICETAKAQIQLNTKKMAGMKSKISHEEITTFEEKIITTTNEIMETELNGKSQLQTIEGNLDDSEVKMYAAIKTYQKQKEEIEQLSPGMVAKLNCNDIHQVDKQLNQNPMLMFESLIQEFRTVMVHYSTFSRKIQYSQLNVWIGTLRLIQKKTKDDICLSNINAERINQFFLELKDISSHYRPGTIQAFSKTFDANWEEYIQDAQDDLLKLTIKK